MYCKVCGTKNNKDSLYCKNDGVKLENIETDIILKAVDNKFCPSCGQRANAENLYCIACGTSFYKTEKIKSESIGIDFKKTIENNKFNIPDINNIKSLNTKEIFNNLNLNSVFFGIAGVVILAIISLILSSSINEFMNMIIKDELGMNLGVKIFKLVDVLPFFIIAPLNIKGNISDLLLGNGDVKIGAFIIALVPIVLFTIMGIVKGILEKEELENKSIVDIFTNSLVFSILMGILSLFSRKKIDIPGLNFLLGEGSNGSIIKSTPLFPVLINSFLFSFLFILLGFSLYKTLSKNKKVSSLNKSFYNGAMVFFMIFIIVVSSVSIMSISNNKVERYNIDPYESKMEKLSEKSVALQIGAYGLGFMNFGELYINEGSAPVLIDSIESLGENFNLKLPSSTFILTMTIISMVVFFILGIKNKKENNKFFYIAPIVYTIFIIFILKVSSFEINISYDDMFMSLKFGQLKLLFMTLAISILPTFAGYVLAKGDNYEAE